MSLGLGFPVLKCEAKPHSQWSYSWSAWPWSRFVMGLRSSTFQTMAVISSGFSEGIPFPVAHCTGPSPRPQGCALSLPWSGELHPEFKRPGRLFLLSPFIVSFPLWVWRHSKPFTAPLLGQGSDITWASRCKSEPFLASTLAPCCPLISTEKLYGTRHTCPTVGEPGLSYDFAPSSADKLRQSTLGLF